MDDSHGKQSHHLHQQHGRRLPPVILIPDCAANVVQEEQLGKIGPLLESHQRRDKALVELERLDEVRPKVFSEGGYVNYKEVRGCWPEQQQAPACSCAVLLFQSATIEAASLSACAHECYRHDATGLPFCPTPSDESGAKYGAGSIPEARQWPPLLIFQCLHS